jgi:hypothetical protein
MNRFLVMVFIMTAAKLALAWQGWSETTLISDDAYYYFKIARNIVTGIGPTFDGMAPMSWPTLFENLIP